MISRFRSQRQFQPQIELHKGLAMSRADTRRREALAIDPIASKLTRNWTIRKRVMP